MRGIFVKLKSFKEYVILCVTVFVLIGMIAVNFYDYNHYMIETQQKDFLRLAKSVTYGIEKILDSEKNSIDDFFNLYARRTLPGMEEGEDSLRRLHDVSELYLGEMPQKRNQMILVDGEGTVIFDVRNPEKEVFFTGETYPFQGDLGEGTSLGRAVKAAEHEYLVPVIKNISTSPDHYLILFINMDEIRTYLNKVMEDEKNNAYVALKTQDGFVISHKNPEQIGLHMVEGRREKYPDLDVSYLEEISKYQLSGEEASYVYDAYWLDATPIVQRKKIASFTPLYLDHEFWVVTLNLDYRHYIQPFQQYMYRGLILSAGTLLLIGWMLLRLLQSNEEKKKIIRENRYLQELNRAIEELNQEREQTVHARKLGQIGMMTEKIAHDFRNFLTSIMGHAEFLLDAPELSERSKNDVEKILEYADHASEMTRQLTKMGRRENLDVKYHYFNITETLSSWRESIQLMCPSGVTFVCALPEQDIWVYGNETQIQEALWNLCSNAIESMSQAGGLLKITAELVKNEEIPHDLCINRFDRTYVAIFVSDTGCGITKAMQKQVFTPFFTTKPAGQGTGLGCGIAYDIMIQHGGDISVTSKEGEGSTFCMYLPCKLEAERRSGTGDHSMALCLSHGGQLPEVKLFEKMGCRCVAVTTSDEGIRQLEERHSWGFVLIECESGQISDYEMIMYICRNHPMVKILLITPIATREILQMKRKNIIRDYLVRPVSQEQVEKILK